MSHKLNSGGRERASQVLDLHFKICNLGPKLQILKWRSGTCNTRFRPPPLSLWLIVCVVVPHTHREHPPNFWQDPKHHNGDVIFAHLVRACLLLVCCLLACLPNLLGPP